MTILRGKPVNGGVAIAASAIITSKLGIAGVAPDILQQGIDALRRQLPPNELPEVIVICDTLAAGAAERIPGVNTVGIAAESAEYPETLEIAVPAVVGVDNLLKSIVQGQIAIIDGERGIVQIDPDSKAIAGYQESIERRRAHPVFIESKHLCAKTQTGETVLVYARASSATGLAQAVEEGADGIVAEPFESEVAGFHEIALTAALGKPIAFPASFADKELIRAAMRLAAPGQVYVLFPVLHFERLSQRMAEVIRQVAEDPANKEFVTAEIVMGALARPDFHPHHELYLELALVDVRTAAPSEAVAAVGGWIGTAKTVLFDLGERVELIEPIVIAGARGVIAVPRLVAKVKDIIRAIGIR